MKLDIIFAGEAKDQQQMLLDLLAPLGIDKYTVTEAKSDRKDLEHTLVAALRRSDTVLLIGGLGSGPSDLGPLTPLTVGSFQVTSTPYHLPSGICTEFHMWNSPALSAFALA